MGQPPIAAGTLPVTPFQQNCSLVWDPATMRGAVVDPGGEIERILTGYRRQGRDHREGPADPWPSRPCRRARPPWPGSSACRSRGRMRTTASCWNRWPNRAPLRLSRQRELRARPLAQGRGHGHGGRRHAGRAPLPRPYPRPRRILQPGREAGLRRRRAVQGLGRAHATCPAAITTSWSNSITGRLWPLGDDMRFVPGHGETSTFGWERKTNPFVCDLALGRD